MTPEDMYIKWESFALTRKNTSERLVLSESVFDEFKDFLKTRITSAPVKKVGPPLMLNKNTINS